MSRKHRRGKNDEAILAHIRNGRRLSEQSQSCFTAALELLTAEYLDAVYGFCRYSLPESEQDKAYDLAHDVFVAAYKAMPRFREESSIKTWLMSIARHKFIDVLRERKKTNRPPKTDSTNIQDDQELWEAMQHHIRTLPLEDRLIIALRLFGKLTSKEIAEILALKPASLRQRYRRAMQRLKRSFQ